MQPGQAIVAGKQQLRLPDPLGQAQRLLVHGEGRRPLAVALVDLAEHDQGHRQVIDQPQPTVEVDGGLRGLDAFRLASIGERAAGHREIRIEARLEPEIAYLFAVSSARRQVSMLRRGSSEL